VTVFGDRAFKEIIRLNDVIRMGSLSDRTGVLARGRDTRELLLSTFAHRQRPCEDTGEGTHCNPAGTLIFRLLTSRTVQK
jgi:hypothetical protein